MIFRRKKKDSEDTAKGQRFLYFNLLPKDYIERRRRAVLNLIQAILLIAVVAGISIVTVQQYWVLGDYQERTREAREELPQYAEALEVEEELNTYRTEYEQRKEFLEGAALPVDINIALRDIADSIPDSVRLTQVYVKGDFGITLDGTAATLHQVSHFASEIRDEVEYMKEPFVTFPVLLGPDDEPERIIFQMEIPWDLGGDDE